MLSGQPEAFPFRFGIIFLTPSDTAIANRAALA
jgi:hypothetical protein